MFCNNFVVLISLMLLTLYGIVTANLIFFNFSIFEITWLAIVFLGFFILINLNNFKLIRINNKTDILIGFFVFLFLFLLSNTLNPQFYSYVRTFPLLETELGLGWHHDTAFHTSLIQSILNFGYPSIAQHDHPIAFYHVFSHYIDAFILKVTNLEPYDSYGLMFFFKTCAFLAAILLFINKVVPSEKRWLFLVCVAVLFPPIIGSWHAIGSHGLWGCSIILLSSMPYFFLKITNKKHLNYKQSIYIFTIIVLVSLSKISSGFMLASLTGFFLLIKSPMQKSTYYLCMAIVVFFLFYISLFRENADHVDNILDFSQISLSGFYDYYFKPKSDELMTSLSISIFILVFILLLISSLIPSRVTFGIFLSSLLTSFVLYLLATVVKGFSTSDVAYFQYGLSSILLLITFMVIIEYHVKIIAKIRKATLLFLMMLEKNKLIKLEFSSFLRKALNHIVVTLLIVVFSFSTKYFFLPSFSLFDMSLKNTYGIINSYNLRFFSEINKELSADNQLSLKKMITSKEGRRNVKILFDSNFSLGALRNEINRIKNNTGQSKSQMGLFIPKAVFDSEIIKFGGQTWAQGLLIYAVTGIQLIHGVRDIPGGYGFSVYKENESALQKNDDDFHLEISCDELSVNMILKLESLSPLKLIPMTCHE